jgi:GTP-binding protein
MIGVNTELGLFDSFLAKKPQLVAVNKIDLPQVRARLAELRESFNSIGTRVLFVSAASGEGTAELMAETMKMLQSVPRPEVGKAKKVFQPKPRL